VSLRKPHEPPRYSLRVIDGGIDYGASPPPPVAPGLGSGLALPTNRSTVWRVGSLSEQGPVPLTAPAARSGPR
jgi:hypothetical protein